MTQVPSLPTAPRIPLWLKLLYTAFMAVLVPVYLYYYGPTNFLYFCDVALILTLVGIWIESPLLVSMCAIGITVPQLVWVIDFLGAAVGFPIVGMTAYMFEAHRSLFLRGLSLFHGWLPFLLIFLVARLGYDRRALAAWTATAFVLCLVAFFLLPPAGAQLANPLLPRNVNYVFGLDDARPQTWIKSPGAYLVTWMAALVLLIFVPTHFVLRRFAPKAA
jgi:hypothetical protein